MAQIVLGMGTSHTPMLNAPPTDWPRFIERDSARTNLLDVEGRLTSYDEQLKHAPPGIAAEITPDRMAARHETVQGAMLRLGGFLHEAKLDALIVAGDDQEELFHRSEEHTSELSHTVISYAVFCLKKKIARQRR